MPAAAAVNFNHLLLFHAVVEHGGFTRAAEALSLRQPGISKQVKEMEKELGVDLLEHIGRKVYLTDAGRILDGYAQRIFSLSDEAEQALRDLKGLNAGRLTLGASLTLGIYVLPPILVRFKQAHAGIQVVVEVGTNKEVEAALLANRLDVGMVEGVVSASEIVRERFREDKLVVVAPPGHPLVGERAIPAVELGRFEFVLRERGAGARLLVERAFAEMGVSMHVALELKSTEAIKRAAAAGLGLAVVPEYSILDDVAADRLIPLNVQGLDLRRGLEIVYHRDKRLSHAARVFIELLKSAESESPAS